MAQRDSTAVPCPGCGAALAENAILCIACGYHLQAGTHLTTVVAAEASGESKPNVYRDADLLVVPIKHAEFPARCIKTNKPVAGTYRFETDLLWQQVQVPESAGQEAANTVAKALFGVSGGAVLDLTRKRRLRFNIGLSAERQALARKRRRLGLALIIGGPIVSFMIAWLVVTVSKNETAGIIAALAFAAVFMITGIVFFALSTETLLRVMRSDGEYVWFGGASAEFLASLPESPVKWTRRKLFGG